MHLRQLTASPLAPAAPAAPVGPGIPRGPGRPGAPATPGRPCPKRKKKEKQHYNARIISATPRVIFPIGTQKYLFQHKPTYSSTFSTRKAIGTRVTLKKKAKHMKLIVFTKVYDHKFMFVGCNLLKLKLLPEFLLARNSVVIFLK